MLRVCGRMPKRVDDLVAPLSCIGDFLEGVLNVAGLIRKVIEEQSLGQFHQPVGPEVFDEKLGRIHGLVHGGGNHELDRRVQHRRLHGDVRDRFGVRSGEGRPWRGLFGHASSPCCSTEPSRMGSGTASGASFRFWVSSFVRYVSPTDVRVQPDSPCLPTAIRI